MQSVGGSSFVNVYDQMGAQPTLRVESYTPHGFTFTNGARVNGPVLAVGPTVLSWQLPPPPPTAAAASPAGNKVRGSGGGQWSFENWNRDMWKVLEVVTPKPEILVVGTGRTFVPLPAELQKYLRSLGIQLEVTDTVSVNITDFASRS
ncbi:hypothetical protein IWQ60_002041 [Tieghemiomyces parasiticus]|uniref:NADH dehydrogenase [ubiquinone] 1 alpha subcomplex assembly factor 3 n=1 Tax=Tieghemiomyces parasiticus TaxID=78921 RepID=A0A9W8E1C9_9FUNG|nr:hypothetical protein IWQ60_002041 [Tieghemiomyces parasiticus]